MTKKMILSELGEARIGEKSDEVVVGITAAFYIDIFQTLSKLDLSDVLFEINAGIEEEGIRMRVVRVMRTSDLAFVGHEAAKLSGSGIGIGLQSKGTVVIHQKDLYPLSNLELFPQAPFLKLEHYRAIGRNAARYAKGIEPPLITAPWDRHDRVSKARCLPLAALITQIEERRTVSSQPPVEVKVVFE